MEGTWQFHPVFLALAASTVVSGAIAAYAFRSRETPGATALGVLLASAGWWSAAYLAQLTRTSAAWQDLWTSVAYVGVAVLPVAWVVFALQYTGSRAAVTPRFVAAIGLPSVLLSSTGLTNGLFGLAWTTTGVAGTSLVVVQRTTDLWYGLHVAYTYLLIVPGVLLLLRQVIRSRQLFRLQGASILLGTLIPVAANVYWLAGDPLLNYTSIVFAVSGAVLAFGFFRYRLLDLVPVARDTVVEEMRDAYVVLDGDRRVVDANPAAERLFSLSDDAVGSPLPSVAPAVDDLVETQGGARRWSSTLVLDGDGDGDGDRTHRFLEVRASPVTEGGDGTVLTVHDATDRQRTQRRFQTSIERATDVVAILDAEGRLEYVSPPVEQLTGYPPDALVGTDSFDLLGDERDEMVRTFGRLRENPGGTERFEARVTGPDGESVVVEGLGRNLLEEPFVEGIVVNIRDITDRRRREQRIERANERLERFASVVSHDLRNPLNVALGHLELTRETGNDEHARTAEHALSRMEDIITDALTLAQNGGVVADPTPVRLGEVSSRARDIVEIEDDRFAVESDGIVAADPDRLQRLLENLVRNAVEHGGDDVAVRVGATDRGFYVEDSGSGISPDRAEEVFESGVTTNDGGTGLGLAIVAEIADAHGWTVRVEPGRTGGARFVVDGASVDSVDSAEAGRPAGAAE